MSPNDENTSVFVALSACRSVHVCIIYCTSVSAVTLSQASSLQGPARHKVVGPG